MRPLFIFLTGLGMYALLTLPTLIFPPLYIISMCYALTYGWIAFAVFAIGFHIIMGKVAHPVAVMSLLTVLVVVSVAVAFHILGEQNKELNAWHSGEYLMFPLLAIVAGIISLFMAKSKILLIHSSNDSSTN